MQRDISTNIRIPEELWRAIKIRAIQEKRSMKDLFLEALGLFLGTTRRAPKKTGSAADLLLSFAGKGKTSLSDGAKRHDHYLYEK